MLLNPSQKNQLAEIIEENGFKISDFNIEEIKSKKIGIKTLATSIRHLKTGYYFIFDTNINHNHSVGGNNLSSFSPGVEKLEDSSFCGQYHIQISVFKQWIQRIEYELSQPDKWNQQSKKVEDISMFGEITDENFNDNEVLLLKEKMSELSNSISQLNLLSTEQSKFLRDKFDCISKKLNTNTNKFDWISQLLGIYINFTITVSMSPGAANELFNLLKITFVGLNLN